MLDSIYHMTLKLFCIVFFCRKRQHFPKYTQLCYERHFIKKWEPQQDCVLSKSML